jgi:hypothetical protein
LITGDRCLHGVPIPGEPDVEGLLVHRLPVIGPGMALAGAALSGDHAAAPLRKTDVR